MQTPDSLQQIYEDLANRYAQEDNASNRDHCLVLAADYRGAAGGSCWIRPNCLASNRLLTTNPFPSSAVAVQLAVERKPLESKDVQGLRGGIYGAVSGRRRCHREKLLRQSWMDEKAAAAASKRYKRSTILAKGQRSNLKTVGDWRKQKPSARSERVSRIGVTCRCR